MGDDSNEDLITAGFFFVPTHNLINNTNLPQVFLCHVYFGLLSVSAQHYFICCSGTVYVLENTLTTSTVTAC